MNRVLGFLLAAAIFLTTACSDAPSGAAASQVDYKKICDHLVPLSPQERRDSFANSCESTYQSYLPACRNAAAVTDCFTKMKAWGERLACIDSCQRDDMPRK